MKNFIQKAIKHPGALHEQLGVPKDKPIPAEKLAAAAKKGGKLGQRARFAETLKGLPRPGKKKKEIRSISDLRDAAKNFKKGK